MHICVDVGGVLIIKDQYVKSNEDTEFGADGPKWMQGWREALIKLKDAGHKLSILSYCGIQRMNDTVEAFNKVNMNEIIPKERWYFVRSRELKLPKMKEIKADIIIDDTYKIINHVRQGGLKALHYGREVNDWNDVIKYFENQK